jgi:hypothetical protein
MRDPNCTDPPADAALAVTALRYAAGDMTPADAEMFEARLADDQAARDALAEAVRLSAAASGLPAPTPDPLVRAAVAERLTATWVSRLFPRRPYRGHPAAWAALGGGMAAALTVAVLLNLSSEPGTPRLVGPAPSHGMFAAAPALDDVVVPPTDANTASRVRPLPMPVHPNLNPMGLEPRPGEAATGPTVMPNPMGMATPMLMPTPAPLPTSPTTKTTGNSVAECPTDPQEPKADPMIGGMIMSRL